MKQTVPEAWAPGGQLEVVREEEDVDIMLLASEPGPAGIVVLDLGSLSLQVDRADLGRLVSIFLEPMERTLDDSQRQALGVILGGRGLAELEELIHSGQLGPDAVGTLKLHDTEKLRSHRTRLGMLGLLDELGIELWGDHERSPWWSSEFCSWARGVTLEVIVRRAVTEAQACASAWGALEVSDVPPRILPQLISAGDAVASFLEGDAKQRVENIVTAARKQLPQEAIAHGAKGTRPMAAYEPGQPPMLYAPKPTGTRSMRSALLASPVEDYAGVSRSTFLVAPLNNDLKDYGVRPLDGCLVMIDVATGEATLELPMPGAERSLETPQLWARVFDKQLGSLLTMGPVVEHESDIGVSGVARLALPVGSTPEQVTVDVSAHPNDMPDWTPRGQLRVALENGRRATTAERVLGGVASLEVASLWESCARSWAQVGDANRAVLAATYASKARREAGRADEPMRDLASTDKVTWADPILTRARVIPAPLIFDSLEAGLSYGTS